MIGDCKIIKELPQGGQKTVHLAEHPKVGKVVIKKGEVELLSELESSVLLDENSDGSHLATWYNVLSVFNKEITK